MVVTGARILTGSRKQGLLAGATTDTKDIDPAGEHTIINLEPKQFIKVDDER